jgi:thiol-disulfide isomerase/thioredoxin
MDQGRAQPLTALLVAALAIGCATTEGGGAQGGGDPSGASQGNRVGQHAPEIVVENLAGKTLKVSSYRGQVLLLDVWASWCIPCKQELPVLDDIATRLQSKGVQVLAVSIDQERENVTKFLSIRNDWFLTIAHDPKGEIADRLQPDKMPTSYIIDRAGIIRYVNLGFVPGDGRKIEKRLLEVAEADGGGRR